MNFSKNRSRKTRSIDVPPTLVLSLMMHPHSFQDFAWELWFTTLFCKVIGGLIEGWMSVAAPGSIVLSSCYTLWTSLFLTQVSASASRCPVVLAIFWSGYFSHLMSWCVLTGASPSWDAVESHPARPPWCFYVNRSSWDPGWQARVLRHIGRFGRCLQRKASQSIFPSSISKLLDGAQRRDRLPSVHVSLLWLDRWVLRSVHSAEEHGRPVARAKGRHYTELFFSARVSQLTVCKKT